MAIFSLNEVRTEQIKNIADDNFESWPENALYGYLAGGYTPTVVNTIERLEFSNETLSLPGNNLPTARRDPGALITSSYGYYCGGYPNVATVARIDFSSETCSAPGNDLPQGRGMTGAVSTNYYGYIACGRYVSQVNHVSRMDFFTEVFTDSGEMPVARAGLDSVQTSSYGYFGGGGSNPPGVAHNTVDRIDFSNETKSAPGQNLPVGRAYIGATSNDNYGYFAGGQSATAYVTTIDRIDLSNETTSAPGNNLSEARGFTAGVSSKLYGYIVGGHNGPVPTEQAVPTIDRIDFTNETVSSNLNLLQGKCCVGALFGGASYRPKGSRTYGYFGGGMIPDQNPTSAIVSRIDFSNETVTLPGNNLPGQGRASMGTVSSSSYGYFGGGINYPPSTNINNTVERIDFSNETLTLPGNELSQSRYNVGSVSSNFYGYFGGGIGPSFVADRVDRLDFSNETTSAPGNELPDGYGYGTVSSSSYGYFAGGSDPPGSNIPTPTSINRIDFSNDSILYSLNPSSIPGSLSIGRYDLADGQIQTNSYGYFGGGRSPSYVDRIDRLDFSNEIVSQPGNELTEARGLFAAVSSESYGYFGGGYKTPSAYVATVDRIDFSNETTSAPGNNLPEAIDYVSGLSN